jgi:hypothetical protein
VLTPPSDPAVDADATRRAFLKKVAIGGAVAAIGTQVLPIRAFAQEEGGSDDTGDDPTDGADNEDDPTSETTEPGSDAEDTVELTPDEQRVTFLAGIGLAAAVVYRAATGDEEAPSDEEGGETTTTAASESTTTTLPPITVPPLAEPVVEVLRVFGSHHSQQATALGGLLAAPVETANGSLVAEVRGAIGNAADEAAVLSLLRDLEERIAATHLQAIADMEDVNDAKLVATALPVVGQHALVLGRIGSSPTPLEELIPEEQTTDGALDEATYPSDGTTAPTDLPGQSDDDANAGGEGAEEGTGGSGGTGETPDDGTESGGGGATDGSGSTDGGNPADPESEG